MIRISMVNTVYHGYYMEFFRIKKFVSSRVDLLILVICLLLTYASWQVGVRFDDTSVIALEDQRQKLEHEIHREVENLFHHLNGVKGLYVGSNEVLSEDFSKYLKVTSEGESFNSLLRIGFIQKVKTSEVNEFEKQIQKIGKADFEAQIVPEIAAQYYVAKVLNPQGDIFTPSGRNLMSDKNLRSAIEQIEQTGEGMTVFSPVTNNIEEYSGPSLAVSIPVMTEGELIGLINGVVSLERVKESIKGILDDDISWKWSDGKGREFYSEGDVRGKVIEDVATIPLMGESEWVISLTREVKPSMSINMIFIVGVLLSFMLYAMVFGLSTANARAENIAREKTFELEKFKLALDSTSAHAIITDANGIILYVNKAAELLTGFSKEEVLGKTPSLWGRQMPDDFYKLLWKTIKTERKVYKGEILNKRKNGELYTASAVISPIISSENNDLIGFVGIEEDVTIRKKNEDELRRMNDLMIGREIKMAELKKEIAKLQRGES